ncbi:MAG: carboxypeptidase M32 [Candidatus Heimdallarchaeota archaeon]|nr:MAG: carboxypeptidase M32 [Candidatus Heimdallarchaeota archaeon]
MDINDAYERLLKEVYDYIVLLQIKNILDWDFETYMPSKGVEQRGEELAMIAKLRHDRITNPKIGELIQAIKNDPNYSSLDLVKRRNVVLTEREYNRESKIPKELVEKIAKHTPIAIDTWKKAKKESNYLLFKPALDKMIELTKEKAYCLDPDKEPFDALVEKYEPGMSSAHYSALFKELKEGLIPVIQKCISSPNQPNITLIKRKLPISIQKQLSEDISQLVLYDLERGRIDETEHPFTTGYYDDVRITTHYYEEDFSDSFYSVLHEAGHGIYEQNLLQEYKYQLVGEFASYGIHESQSRFIENLIGRSSEFWEFYLPRLKKMTGNVFSDVELDLFVHALNEVKPSKIRITADEVTYSLHIIIRFEIERDLLAGKITTDQLPDVWNEKYREYLGVDVENDAEGVLQDTHWAGGSFSYFPSYAMGNIYNAHMLEIIARDIPDYKELIKKGELNFIIDWLVENVHSVSNLYDPPELIKRITGEEISPKYFIKYLEEKFSKIYGF